MSLIAKAYSGASKFVSVPPGLHLARCYRIIELGTQLGNWKGQQNQKKKIMVQFEVHGNDADGNPLLTDKGEPLSISKNYTFSLNENASLSKDLESWRNQAFTKDQREGGFDVKKILGVWAMISITKDKGDDGNEYTNISNINSVPQSIKQAGLPEGFNELKFFDIDEPDMELFESLGPKIKEKIMGSPEWQKKHGGKVVEKPKPQNDDFGDSLDDVDF